MLTDLLVTFAALLPRGGARLLRLIADYLPSLRSYPQVLPFTQNVVISADFRNNVFFPLLKYGCYPHQIAEDLITICFLKNGDSVIDVGANIGHVTAICATCVGPTGVVHAFEPSKVTFHYITQVAHQLPQVKPWNYAVSESSGTVSFLDETLSDRSHITTSTASHNSYPIESVNLDEWGSINNINRVDFIKIDAEGYDLQVIKGAFELINRTKPLIEFEVIDDNGKLIKDFLTTACKDVNYKIYRVMNIYPLNALSKAIATNNYFAVPFCKISCLPDFLFHHSYLQPYDF